MVSPPADAGPGGRGATLLDPEGCEIRRWQARRRLGAQVANTPGAWNFSNLNTADLASAQRFYGDHLQATIAPDIRSRQADAPEGFEDVIGAIVPAGALPPGWSVVLTVADRDETVARTEALGGTVLHATENDWTRDAVVRDPQGAVFTASQFAPADT